MACWKPHPGVPIDNSHDIPVDRKEPEQPAYDLCSLSSFALAVESAGFLMAPGADDCMP